MLQDPSEVLLADRGRVRIGRGIQEIDRVRDAVPDRELQRIEVVTECLRQLQAVAADPLVQRGLDGRRVLDVPSGMRLPRVVTHDVHVLASDDVAAEILLEGDLLLKRHHVLPGSRVGGEELLGARDPVNTLPPAAGVGLEIGGEPDVGEDRLPIERICQI